MGKKKVTLSLESKVYDEFKKFCDDNAIMLSKKIELIMKDILKKKFLFIFFLSFLFLTSVQAAVFEDKTSTDFNAGTHFQTYYNSTIGAIQINNTQGYVSGNFTSRIFQALSSAAWNNFSWIQRGKYGFEYPNNSQTENFFGGLNMSGNVLLYHLNELSGTFFDSSGNGNNGTLAGSMTRDGTGKFGTIAVDAKGSNGRISAPSSTPSLTFNQTITLESWIRWTGESGENFNLQNVITAGNNRKALRVTEPDHFVGGSQVLSYFNIGGVDVDLYSNKKVAVANWTHIVTTYNGTALSIYINGKHDVSNTTVSGEIVANNDNYYIGAESGSISNFDGLIEEVAIYNRALSAEEIQDRYDRGTAALNVSVRSCDDAACSGESFIKLNNTSPQQLNLSNNSYFQYSFFFTTENNATSPAVYNVSTFYTESNIPPSVNIIFPVANSLINYNTSIPLNFTVSDDNLQSCWYSLDNGQNNFTISNCQNTTFNTTEGAKNLKIFANDTAGAQANSSVSFTIDITSPQLIIIHPQNISYGSLISSLNYSVSDDNLQSCWYSLDNDETNTTITCGENLTGLSSSQGSNTWKIFANDSAGNSNSSSQTFFIDSILPLISFGVGTENDASVVSRNWIFVNVSIEEINEANITFSLRNSTSLVNSTTFANFARTINWTNLPDGNYFYNVTVLDSVGNSNTTETRQIIIDRDFPNINFISPTAANYSNATILVNISSNGDNVWFYNGTANETYTSPVYRTFSEGNNLIFAFANDTAGNFNSTNISFEIDSVSPAMEIINPISGSAFGTNTSLALNFTAEDSHLQSCWYKIDDSSSIPLPNCENTTFDISEGAHIIYLFANDSFGNIGTDNSSFSVQVGSPSISLISPVGDYLNYTQDIELIYVASDTDLQSCQLWGNFSGTFALNQTDNSVSSGQENSFFVNLSDGDYLWNVACNDSFNHISVVANETFHIDTINPFLILSEPRGTYSSRTNIPISFSAADASPINCYYRIYRGSNLETPNTAVSCSGTSNFAVTLDADFIFSLFVEDPVGHFNTTNSTFSVNTNPGTGSSPNQGSGGGGGSVSPRGNISRTRNANLRIESQELILKEGTSKEFIVEVSSRDSIFLNKCYLIFEGELENFFASSQTKGLASGERYAYLSEINLPQNLENGTYETQITVQCDEGRASQNMNVLVYRNSFEPELLDYVRDGNNLIVSYEIQEFSGQYHEITVDFSLLDLQGIPNYVSQRKISLNPSESKIGTIEFNLPKDSFGEFTFTAKFNDGESFVDTETEIFLPSSTGVTGLAISEENKRTLSYIGIAVLIALAIAFGYWFFQFKRKIRAPHFKVNRHFERHHRFKKLSSFY